MSIKHCVMLVVIVTALPSCISLPQSTTVEFTQADQNRDGFVTLAEWLNFGGTEAAFLAIDRSRFGYLKEAEFREALRLSDQGGQVTERQQAHTDQQLVSQVESRLKDEKQLNSWNIRVQSVQRQITLSGVVRTSQEKSLAEKITRTVEGVSDVYNQITIRQ
ncbi:MAG: BON domain-containing protein [Flavobacteriales bacterium]